MSVGYSIANACVLTGGGQVQCWRERGPEEGVPAGRYVAVAVGQAHVCALTGEGEAVCRTTSTYHRSRYDPQIAPPGRYSAISAGSARTCAVTLEGEVVCWGDTDYELRPIPPL